MENSSRKIKIGDYIIIQRQKYTKLHKFSALDTTASLGKEQIVLRNIDGHFFQSTFKMMPKESTPQISKRNQHRQRVSILEIVSQSEIRNLRKVLNITESGTDNRDIHDNGVSQSLRAEDIQRLREECTGSSEIVEKIIENSKTFNSKTEYAQEKYLKKKEKKYFEFVQIREPSIRLIAEIFYRQDADKIMGIRMDILSQMLSYSGISSFGNYLLYESGTNGLVPAAFLNSMGAGTESKLVYMHPGNVPQTQAILALDFPQEQLDRCIAVNIYSVLREYFQGNRTEDDAENDIIETGQKRKAESVTDGENGDESSKKLKIDKNLPKAITDNHSKEDNEKPTPKWRLENENALKIMKDKFDGLIIVAREHPASIVKNLMPFLKPSRPIVIYSSTREVLMELYVTLKSSNEATGLHLTSNWLRMYQILPNRTHPEVNMNGNGGFLLYGYSIC